MNPTKWSQFKQFRTLKMDKNQQDQMAENEVVQDNTVVDMPSTEVETGSVSNAEVTENADTESKMGSEEENKQSLEQTDRPEKRPSRIERNLGKVLEKNKQLATNLSHKDQELDRLYKFITNKEGQVPAQANDDSLFSQEDLENGAILDPKAFDERINRRIEKEVNERLQRTEQRSRVKQLVESHMSELQEVEAMEEFADDEVFDTYLEFYENTNYVGGNFIGKQSPKQVAERFLKGAKKYADRYASNITSRMVQQQMDEGGVSPTNDVRPSTSNNLDNLYQKALEAQSDEAWSEYFKAKFR